MAEIAAQRIADRESANQTRRETGGGLGKSLADILDATAARAPLNEQDITYSVSGGRFQGTGGLNALFPSGGDGGADFGPYTVSQAAQYYQGPTNSTRVAKHQFIPLDPDWESKFNMSAHTLRGNIYVRFWRKTGDPGAPEGDLWRYGPCSLSDYRTFRESSSKGRAVRSLEAFGHGSANNVIVNGLSI
jgi:hypothetical protein